MRMSDNWDDDEPEIAGRGRSARKREIHRFELLAMRLLEISDAKCNSLPVTDKIKSAVIIARATTAMKAKAARKRYIKHLSSLLRGSEAEADAIEAFLEGRSYVAVTGDESYRNLDALRAELVDPASFAKAVEVVCREYPHIDLALLTEISHRLHTQHSDKDFRNLFKELRRAADEREQDEEG